MVAAEVDSRQYRFGFVANACGELPADFGVLEMRRGFVSGLFLPGEDAPPRIILLYDGALEIRSHPASGEKPVRIPLGDLESLERGHLLLLGWLRFGSERFGRNLAYNTCSDPSVLRFLTLVRGAWLHPGTERRIEAARLGCPLDLKFTNALAAELMPGEEILVQYFRPAERRLRRLGPLRRESWSPADLVAVTGLRVIWITDRHRGRHEPYGTVTRFAPSRAVAGYACISGGLAISLKSGALWQIPVAAGEACAFVRAAESLC